MTTATVRQFPETSRWILTATFCLHAVNPSLASTSPEVTRCLASRREMVRGWVGPTTVKLVVLVAVPPGAVTEIRPVVAPAGTVAVILVEELTVKDAEVLLNLTPVTLVKFVPKMLTEVPTAPLVGENAVTLGAPATVTVKFVELVAVPLGLVTVIGPVKAPEGTMAVI